MTRVAPWLCGLLLLAAAGAARADDLAGRWLNTGPTGAGGYSLTLALDGNGGLQAEVVIGAALGAGGSGVTRCEGRYTFDGQTLRMAWSACVACPAGGGCVQAQTGLMPSGGPVTVLGPGMITIGSDRFTRL